MSTALIAVSALAVAELVALVVVLRNLRRVRGELADLEATVVAARPARSPALAVAEGTLRALGTSAGRLRRDGIKGLLTSSFEDLERWASEDRTAIVQVAGADGTTTIVFTDIENSTAYNDEVGDRKWVRVLAAHERVVTSCVRAAHGHIVKNQGDGFMIAFSSADDAVDAAIAIERHTTRSIRELRSRAIAVRIGLHTGTVVNRSGDFFGRNVAVAARVANLADGGQILATGTVVDALTGDGVTVRDLGAHSLKGVREQVPVFEIAWRPA